MNAHNEQHALPCPFCGAEPDLSFNSVSCGCAASPFIDREDALQVWNTRAAQPAAAQEAVGWFTDDHLIDKSATTYDPLVAERWRNKGWPVTALYAAPVTAAPAKCPACASATESYCCNCGWASASTPAAPEPSYLEYLDLQNHSLRRAIHAMMAKLVFLLDEDQFADIDAIALAAGVTPAAPGIDLREIGGVMAEAEKHVETLHSLCPRASVFECIKRLRKAQAALIDASPKGDESMRDWSLRMAKLEEGQHVGAGAHGIPDSPKSGSEAVEPDTFFVMGCPGYPGGYSVYPNTMQNALKFIAEHGNEHTTLATWCRQYQRRDYTAQEVRALLASDAEGRP